MLLLTAYDQYKKELFTWSWPIKAPEATANFNTVKTASKIETTEPDSTLLIKSDGISYYFSKKNGNLQKVVTPKSTVSLSNGPVLAGGKYTFKQLNHYMEGQDLIVEPIYDGTQFKAKWTFTPGKLVKLDYQYSMRGEADFIGITFNYPEEKITGMKWEGRGPYRVWKNRLKGQQFGVWYKDYNNTITGESWVYPEFKGYHADVYWVTIENKESPFTVYTTQSGTFLEMLKPQKPAGANNDNTNPPFPEGNIGFMDAISPIGTKFQSPDKLGPQSQKNMYLNYTPIKGALWFDFK